MRRALPRCGADAGLYCVRACAVEEVLAIFLHIVSWRMYAAGTLGQMHQESYRVQIGSRLSRLELKLKEWTCSARQQAAN
jgi:hypothetical protein